MVKQKKQKQKNHNPEEVVIYSGKLKRWQSETCRVLRKWRFNSIVCVKSMRQTGKSYMLTMYSLAQSINIKDFRTVIVSPTFANSKKIYKEMKRFCGKMPNGVVTSLNSTDLEITFWNGSSIQLKSIEQGDALRGDHCNLLIMDEAAFIDMNDAMQLCFPYINTTHGTILLISTPLFKDENNLFYRFWKMGVERKTSKVVAIDWTTYDTSSMLSEEMKQMYKETMAVHIYLSEILGQFIDAQCELWNIEPILKNNTVPTPKQNAGLDWATGTNNDETVLSIFNEFKQQTALFRYKDKTPTETVDLIVKLLKEHNVRKLVVESNSIGEVYLDMLKRKVSAKHVNCQIIPFNTSNTSKREIIEGMQVEIQNQTCSLLNDNTLKLQFIQFTVDSTPSGKVTYHNISDSVHDDIVIATALALYSFKSGNYSIK